MSGITITEVKVVGLCSKCRKEGDEIPRLKDGTPWEDEDIACIGCALSSGKKDLKGCRKVWFEDGLEHLCGFDVLCNECKEADLKEGVEHE